MPGTISVQVLHEIAVVIRGKYRLEWNDIRATVADIRHLCGNPQVLTMEVHESAVGIAQRYGLHFYDSLIVASALAAGGRILDTEDLPHNQQIDDLTVVNPFLAAATH